MRLIALVGVLYVIAGVLLTLMAVSRYFFDYIPPGARMTRVQLFWFRFFMAWAWWFMAFSPVGRTGIQYLLHSAPEDLTAPRQRKRTKGPR